MKHSTLSSSPNSGNTFVVGSLSRPLKFRAWDKYSKVGKMIQPNDGDFIKWHSPSNWMNCYVIMQFINSNDRNGIEVYEGDILEAPSGNLFIVRWYEEEMRWAMWAKDTWYNMNMALHTVVGNIYETPELLNGVF